MKKYNVCIVGGGSTYTLGFLKSFARMQEEFPLNKLVLFDIDGERQKPIGQYGDIMFSERYPELDFSYTTDPAEAYQDMDFIFMQMRAGGLPMRREDEHIPLAHGKIGQETCGAGGMAYGLRSCVDMIEAIHQIRQYSPEAWILNYSNPAAIVAEALRREFPDDKKILNICDQPENVVRSTSRLLGYDWEDLDPVYFGLNHYGWFTHIYDKNTGEDLLPKVRQIVKEKGYDNITAEVCPHHFILSSDDIKTDDPNYKMNPPLRTPKDVEALKQGLKDGTIEVISTDHAPHSTQEKTGSMKNAPFGIVGLETSLPLTYTELVEKDVITLKQMVEKMCLNPAKILGLDSGTLQKGHPADVIIVDTEQEYAIDKNKFVSKGHNTPFDGWKVKGKVLYTICDGKIVFKNQEEKES